MRFAAHLQTQKLDIKSSDALQCLIVRQRTCSHRWHTRRVPQTEVSERLVLILSPVKKTRCVQQHARPRLWTTVPTLHEHGLLWIPHKKSSYRRHAFKQTHGDKCRVQCSSCCDINASRSKIIHLHNRNFLAKPCSQPPTTQTQHLVINRPSAYLLKPYDALGGCHKLKKWSACLFTHALQNRNTDD